MGAELLVNNAHDQEVVSPSFIRKNSSSHFNSYFWVFTNFVIKKTFYCEIQNVVKVMTFSHLKTHFLFSFSHKSMHKQHHFIYFLAQTVREKIIMRKFEACIVHETGALWVFSPLIHFSIHAGGWRRGGALREKPVRDRADLLRRGRAA